MKGNLLNYVTKNVTEITKVNHYLFGRVIKNSKNSNNIKYYYYPGILDTKRYVKISRGCYFCIDIIEQNTSWYKLTPADISLDESTHFITAREMWRDMYKGIDVTHL